MIGLTDQQLKLVETGAGYLTVAQRDKFLRSLAGRLRGDAFTTDDLAHAIQFILSGCFGVSAPLLVNKERTRAHRVYRRGRR
jgi:hypothetical protein